MPLTTFIAIILFFVLLRENASTDDESTDIILLDPTHPYSHSLHKLDILAKTKQGTENTYCKSFFPIASRYYMVCLLLPHKGSLTLYIHIFLCYENKKHDIKATTVSL